MEQPKRKVKVFKMVKLEGMKQHEKVFAGIGYFHQWGNEFEEMQVQGEYIPAQYTVGIVEFPDGTVQGIPVQLLQFDDIQ